MCRFDNPTQFFFRAMKLARGHPPGDLFARPHGAGQSAVVGPILGVPQRLSPQDPLSQHVELLSRTSRGFRGLELLARVRGKILVMPIFHNGLKNIPHLPHRSNLQLKDVPLKNSIAWLS
jgi:hypothetical protein